jgi:O-antigen/teichoic acid export membrane protein
VDGPGYSASFPVLVILTIGMLAHFMEMPAHTVLIGLCKHRVVALFTLIQGLANVILSLILARRFGVTGVAMGTMAPMILLTGLALTVYFRRFLKLSLLNYLRQSCASAVLIQGPFVALLLIVRQYYTPTTLIAFFGAVAIAGLPYLGLAMLVCVTRAERGLFIQAIGRFTLLLRPRFS